MRAHLTFTVLGFLIPVFLLGQAQDFGKFSPGSMSLQEALDNGSIEKVRARFEYFHNRITYPGGTVPVGARAKAFLAAKERMPLFGSGAGTRTQAAYEWINQGPFNIGGRIIAVAVNPKNPRTLFIGAADGGVWRSFDEGKSWHSVSDNFPVQAIGSIVIDPVDTSVVYTGTGEASFAQRTFDGGGIFKSTDGGTTWSEIGAGTLPPFARASDMCINPLDPRILYVAVPDGVRDEALEGIYRSTDAGATWELVLTGRMSDIVLDPQNPSTLYTVSSKVFGGGTSARYGMHKSTDGGATWTKLDVGVTDSLMGRTSIGICAGNPDVLYIGVSEVTGADRTRLMGVLKTVDGGATWTKLPVPFDYMVSQGWYDNIIGVHPSNPDIVYAGGVKLIFSTDGGQSWTRVPDQGFGGILHVDQHAIEFNPVNPDRVYIGNDGGFFIGSQGGSAWEKSDLGLSITQFIGGAMHPATDAFLLGGTQDNGTMLSSSAPMFDLVLYGDGGNGAINPLKPNVMFTTQENLKLWRSEDFGRTWTRAMGNLTSEQSLFYIEYSMDYNTPSTLYLGTYKMYRTTDDGRTWTLLRDCLFQVGGSCYYISSVYMPRYDSRIVLAGATGGYVGVSTDAGTSWQVTTTPLPTGYCSAVRSYRPGVIYATYSRYGVDKVWRSTDMGATWNSINTNLPDIPVNDIIELDGKLVLGTDLGTFISDDDGATWQRFGTGMPPVSVQKFAYNAATGTLRAMTHGRGMYDMRWSTPTVSAPVFLSRPDTSALETGQTFTYAPVVSAIPSATFRLVDAPSGADIDPVLGVVRWKASVPSARFTVEASNASGNAMQVFTLPVNTTMTADWKVVSAERMSSAVNTMRYAGGNTLWLARDSAWVSRSLDGGQSWEHMRIPATNASVYSMHAFDNERIIVGTRGGQIFKSTDGGANWRQILFSINARFGNLHFWDDMNGIAITQGERDSADVYLTNDGGETWGRAAQRNYARFPLDNTLHFFDRNNGWYASSNNDSSPPRDASILHTTDGGLTWMESGAGTRQVSDISFLTPLKGYVVDEVQGRVRRTANGGASWNSTFSFPMNGLRTINVVCDQPSNRIWIITDTSAWMSWNEGSAWLRTLLVPAGPTQSTVFADSIRGWAVSRTGVVQTYARGAVTSVHENEALPAELRIATGYPNPLTPKQPEGTIVFDISMHSLVRATVRNSAGKETATLFEDSLPAGRYYIRWDSSKVPAGVYFYTITANSQAATQRIVVVR